MIERGREGERKREGERERERERGRKIQSQMINETDNITVYWRADLSVLFKHHTHALLAAEVNEVHIDYHIN